MNQQDFEKTWNAFKLEHDQLVEQRTDLENQLAEIHKKIAHLDEALGHIAPLAGFVYSTGNDISHLGLTDAIRRVLQDSNERLLAQDVRRLLAERGYDLSGLTAPMASIYKILSRLEESGKVLKEKEGFKSYYKFALTDEDIPF